jgi:FO synthase
MPGTAAEILDTEIRQQLTKDKLTTAQWVEIIQTAHRLGLPTTATIMYGHIDGPEHWAAHLALLRSIQQKTGGFTEFVPLGFIHYKTPLYLEVAGVRPGPTRHEHIRMHAVARLMLNGWIDNIQASWDRFTRPFFGRRTPNGSHEADRKAGGSRALWRRPRSGSLESTG